jgi:L-fuconolactonase
MAAPHSRIVDSHFHIFDLAARDAFPRQNPSHGFPSAQQAALHRSHTVEEAGAEMATAGIKNAVFVQCYNDCPEEVDWVFQQVGGLWSLSLPSRGLQARKHRFLKGVVGGLDLTKHDGMKETIAKYSGETRPKFVGVRHLIDFEDDDFLTRPEVHAGLAILETHGLTFDLQSYPATLRHVPLIAGKFPGLRMVIDHIAKPHYLEVGWMVATAHVQAGGFAEWAADMAAAAGHPNVYCKLSGLINEVMMAGPSIIRQVPFWTTESYRPYVAHCLAVFGPARCMYGR